MKQFYYIILTLWRGHGSNVIKVISLSLGLFIGIVLFARVAYELSYNTGYDESDRLFIIMAQESEKDRPGKHIRAWIAQAFMDNFPEEVETATVIRDENEQTYFVGKKRYVGETILTDTLFFETMGIPLISGEATGLMLPHGILISEEFSLRIFNSTDVIGKTIINDSQEELIIRGVYKNVPDNSSVRPDIILSYGDMGNRLGVAFTGYVRLNEKADVRKVNERFNAVIKNYGSYNPGKESTVHFSLQNMRKEYISNPAVKRVVSILSFLAIALLLISAMNYVLISISGLSGRIKGIGIHKCNGASSREIFSMFLGETAILILLSVVIVILLIINLSGFIGELIEANVSSLFRIKTLWVPLCVVAVIFILSAIIPGTIYSKVSVTQLFRTYSDHNTQWKKVLLFIQFGGVAFIFGISMVVFLQYERVVNYDLGYSTENMAVGRFNSGNTELAVATIRNLPMVEKVAVSQLPAGNRYTMDYINDEKGERLFLSGINWVSSEFVEMHEYVILEGRNVMAPGEVLVNEEFVRLMKWTDGAIGKNNGNEFQPGTVVGVLKDFVDNSLFEKRSPLFFIYSPSQRTITVKLREPFQESLANLNKEVQEIFPTSDIAFTSFEQRLSDRYASVRRFRDSAGVAFVSILIIALIGLFGYINDEIQRRSKEIGIRKVNGAQAGDILKLLNQDIIIVALPAVVIGTFLSYFIGREWLDQFSGTQIDLSIPFYLLLIIIMIIIIIGSVIAKSWRIANDNPVNSIRNE